MEKDKEIVGLIPASGTANRLAPLPCSKELFPVGMNTDNSEIGKKPRVVTHYMLDRMRLAGVLNAFFIIRKGKWDIPAYFGDGNLFGLQLGYLMMRWPYGTAYTVDQAYAFVKNKTVVFGFPDILFTPPDAFQQLISKKKLSSVDIVLGLFPATNPQKMDMVALNSENQIIDIDIKPDKTELIYTWIIAVWAEQFTEFLHDFIAADLKTRSNYVQRDMENGNNELHIGAVMRAAKSAGLRFETVIFDEGRYIDIGTPEDLNIAQENYHSFQEE